MEKVVEKLNENGFVAKLCDSREDLIKNINDVVGNKSAKIGAGGSATLAELDVLNLLKQNGHQIFSHGFYDGASDEIYALARNAEFYFSSANAITKNGLIVNIDGKGNRVSSLIFGVPTVVIVAGKNKIVPSVEAGIKRTKDIACPLNAKRLGRKTPCATGKCTNCNSPDRMCKATVILEKPCSATKVYVFLINENLGY